MCLTHSEAIELGETTMITSPAAYRFSQPFHAINRPADGLINPNVEPCGFQVIRQLVGEVASFLRVENEDLVGYVLFSSRKLSEGMWQPL